MIKKLIYIGEEMEKGTAGCRAYHLNYIVGGDEI